MTKQELLDRIEQLEEALELEQADVVYYSQLASKHRAERDYLLQQAQTAADAYAAAVQMTHKAMKG